eukprot:UN02158
MYEMMDKYKVPTARHLVLQRSKGDKLGEFKDYIIVNGQRLDKPFVEKPISGSDHNVYIYFDKTKNYGSTRLFRKKKDRSSQHCPDVSTLRTEGDYLYEEMIKGNDKDIKVYTIGET